MELVQLVQSLSRVRLFVSPWTAAHQASLSIINSWSLLKLMSIESVMPSNHLILCYPLLLLSPLLIMAGRSIPLLCIEGVPDLHGAPQDEALARYSVSREVPCSVLKWETVHWKY